MKITGLIIFLCTALVSGLFGATRYVPSGYATIQNAINASSNGDTVVVAPGTYCERLFIENKGITLRTELISANYVIDATNLSGGTLKSVISVVGSKDSLTTIRGFEIKGGEGNYYWWADKHMWATFGGGVFVWDSDISIIECDIHHNGLSAGPRNYGAGIAVVPQWQETKSPNRLIRRTVIIKDCDIHHNFASGEAPVLGDGHGVWINYASEYSEFNDNLVHDNWVDGSSGPWWKAVAWYLGDCASFDNNEIYDNEYSGVAIYGNLTPEIYITNCEIYNNTYDGLVLRYGSPFVEDCSIYDNGHYGVYGNVQVHDYIANISWSEIYGNGEQELYFVESYSIYWSRDVDMSYCYVEGWPNGIDFIGTWTTSFFRVHD